MANRDTNTKGQPGDKDQKQGQHEQGQTRAPGQQREGNVKSGQQKQQDRGDTRGNDGGRDGGQRR